MNRKDALLVAAAASFEAAALSAYYAYVWYVRYVNM